jgi:predicted  nucleic acid-binding Zn-ribbon protein
MAETDIATMTFELLKRMQGQLNRMEADLGDVKLRLTALEHQFGQQATQIAALNGRMDRSDERLGRIERRLEPIDA